ncbi:hypothetical protein HPB50_024252 [Hyalomma asiaticum]|uniref:Uncharacterized protein n=1 Tax=Hyalomma asiaticum TaxID=266040 RepID=A0ACB7S9I8_HYAAI|nr:hypothetical protein HPB50_024252 [Hyalomma asiaticum]
MFPFRSACCPQRAPGEAWRGPASACAGVSPLAVAQWARPTTASAFDPSGTGHRQRAPGAGDLFVARRHHRRSRPRCDATAGARTGLRARHWCSGRSIAGRSTLLQAQQHASDGAVRCNAPRSLKR